MNAVDAKLLTPLAHDIIRAGSYGKLVANGSTPALAHKLLGGVTPDQLFTVPIVNWPAAYAALAGLWLWHDCLHECHEIVQKDPAELHPPARYPHGKTSNSVQKVDSVRSVENEIELKRQDLADMTATLAFWHGIMHRREGDFWNSHYWFRRVGQHPAMKLIEGYGDGHAFIDEVEAAHNRGDAPAALIEKQRREWAKLFEWCGQQK